MTERLHPSGQHLCGGSVRLGGMALGRFDPLAGGGPALIGAQASLSQLRKPRADGLEAVVDLPSAAAWAGTGLAVHAVSMPDPAATGTPQNRSLVPVAVGRWDAWTDAARGALCRADVGWEDRKSVV